MALLLKSIFPLRPWIPVHLIHELALGERIERRWNSKDKSFRDYLVSSNASQECPSMGIVVFIICRVTPIVNMIIGHHRPGGIIVNKSGTLKSQVLIVPNLFSKRK